ncbi:hypothetical protein [Streptomyces gossypii]|nr:hypothetical protein [Streptomyces gossypii]
MAEHTRVSLPCPLSDAIVEDCAVPPPVFDAPGAYLRRIRGDQL